MERASKLLVLGWACLALWAELWLLRGWGLNWLAYAGFLTALVLVAVDRRAIALVLVFAYIFPATIRLTRGFYIPQFSAIWMAALLGALVADGVRSPWHVPARWRGALLCWALVVMAGVPIVIGREIDFNPVLLFEPRMDSSVLGLMPQSVVSFVLHVGVLLVVGILWFDWLFGQRGLDFRRFIVTPLLASALVMAGVAMYQLFVDVTFLNETVYGNVGRASGTVYDANVCGTVAALWIGGAVVWASAPGPREPSGAPNAAAALACDSESAPAAKSSGDRRSAEAGGGGAPPALDKVLGRRRAMILAIVVAGLWLAVWATGSRTSFAAALIVSGFSLLALYRARSDAAAWRLTAPRALAVAGVLVVLIALLAGANLGVVGPVQRLWDSLPGMTPSSPASWGDFALELWNRNWYGAAANAMIREFPFFGVGVGAFHHIAPEFVTNFALPPDNAQNWFRHQLTEFGVIGSLGWIVWVVAFAAFVLRRPSQTPPIAWAARGMLIAFAVISLVGMPAQDVIAAITFWTAAYWFVSLAGVSADTPVSRWSLSDIFGKKLYHGGHGNERRPQSTDIRESDIQESLTSRNLRDHRGSAFGSRALSKWTWAAIITIVIAYTAGTTMLARSRLRVPIRALETGKTYSYGFYHPERDLSGEFRWARRRAAIVLDAPTDWIVLRVSVNHRDVATNPVAVKVWRDGVRVINTRLQTNDPVTTYVHIPGGRKRTLLETQVSRVVKPKDYGVEDPRELGLLVRWNFVDSPNAGPSMSR